MNTYKKRIAFHKYTSKIQNIWLNIFGSLFVSSFVFGFIFHSYVVLLGLLFTCILIGFGLIFYQLECLFEGKHLDPDKTFWDMTYNGTWCIECDVSMSGKNLDLLKYHFGIHPKGEWNQKRHDEKNYVENCVYCHDNKHGLMTQVFKNISGVTKI
jgi:hypothetical protein